MGVGELPDWELNQAIPLLSATAATTAIIPGEIRLVLSWSFIYITPLNKGKMGSRDPYSFIYNFKFGLIVRHFYLPLLLSIAF